MSDASDREGAERARLTDLLRSVALAHARREFDARVELDQLSEHPDLLELGATLNMLGEELEATTVAVEELAELNEALRRTNAELDEFTYIASHDLQTPIRHVVNLSEMLQMDLEENVEDDSREILEALVDAGRQMQRLVQALLALSRSSRATLQFEAVSLEECADAAIASLSEAAAERQASVTREALPTVQGDATVLTQLFQNLIANALKFTKSGRPTVRISSVTEGHVHVIDVEDNGIGIPGESIGRLFAPFVRLQSADEFEGTGIGLAICRKVVERHGGRIWVESEPGVGSHFKFALPALG